MLNRNGAQVNDDVGSTIGARVSDDGRYVAFPSIASAFVTGDTGGNVDVFVSDVGTDCPAPRYYCESIENSQTLVNGAMIGYEGSTSVSANDLVLSADNMPDQPGIFIAGPTADQAPFFNGFLCINPNGLQRFSDTTAASGGVITEFVDLATSAPGGGSGRSRAHAGSVVRSAASSPVCASCSMTPLGTPARAASAWMRSA